MFPPASRRLEGGAKTTRWSRRRPVMKYDRSLASSSDQGSHSIAAKKYSQSTEPRDPSAEPRRTGSKSPPYRGNGSAPVLSFEQFLEGQDGKVDKACGFPVVNRHIHLSANTGSAEFA